MSDQAVPQDSQPPPPFTYSSATQQTYGNPEKSNTTVYSQPPQTGQSNTTVYSQPPQTGQSNTTVYSQPPQKGQSNTTVYSQPPQTGQSNTTVYSQPPQTGQSNTIVYTQPPQYGTPITGQPVMAQAAYGQQIVMQNQYGQPMVVQGGMQPVGVVPMVVPLAINPNDPAQNEHSVRTKCPHCQQEISTTVHYEVGSCTWLWCILLAFMGCILCCCFPFLWKGAKDAVHTCPNCKAEVGRFIRQQRSNVRVHAGGHHRRRRRRR